MRYMVVHSRLLQKGRKAVLNIPVTDAYERAVELIVEQVHRKKTVTSGMGKAGQIAMVSLPPSALPVFRPFSCTPAKHSMVTSASSGERLVASSSQFGQNSLKSWSWHSWHITWTRDWSSSSSPETPTAPSAHENPMYALLENPKKYAYWAWRPVTSTTAMTVIGDILVVQTMKQTGFTIEDFSSAMRRLPRREKNQDRYA